MLELRPVPVTNAHRLDGLRLIDAGGEPLLLYSMQKSRARMRYEMMISAAPVADVELVSEVATLTRLLPARPEWDARFDVHGNYELVFKYDTGALKRIVYRDGCGRKYSLGSAHPLESFGRPHFVRGEPGMIVPDVAAIAANKKVVIFPQFTANRDGLYIKLADGADGIVTGNGDRLVVAKSLVSGPSSYNVLPGRLSLTLARSVVGTALDPQGAGSIPFPDLIAFEFDAALGRGEVFVLATAKPAVLLVALRPARPIQLAAPDRRWLNALSMPTISVSETHVHVAAIANRGAKNAVVLYGALAIDSVFAP